jgi:hypothetical protein
MNRKFHYSLIAAFFFVGFVLIGLSILFSEKEINIASLACQGSHTLDPGVNTSLDFDASVDPYNECFVEMYGDIRGTSDNYIHFIFYREPDLDRKRIEGWIRSTDQKNPSSIEIPESGDWILYLENDGGYLSRVHVDITYNSLKDKPLTEMALFRAGIIFVLYSFIAFLVVIYFYRIRRIQGKKTSSRSNGKNIKP